jgi:hypothetical protein
VPTGDLLARICSGVTYGVTIHGARLASPAGESDVADGGWSRVAGKTHQRGGLGRHGGNPAECYKHTLVVRDGPLVALSLPIRGLAAKNRGDRAGAIDSIKKRELLG